MSHHQNPDIAALLPPKREEEYARKTTIYGPGQPCNHLYLVRTGRVLITNYVEGASSLITGIVGAKGIFGEGVLAAAPSLLEAAETLDQTRVLSWSRAEIEEHVSRDPRIGMALMQYFARRCVELNHRLEGFAFHKTSERVILALLELAENLGTPAGGFLHMEPLTHQVMAEYIGTSREIVTSHLAEFRRAGLVRYSRTHLEIDVEGMKKRLSGDLKLVRGAG